MRLIIILCLLITAPAFAQSKREQLGDLDAKLKSYEAEQKAQQDKAKQIEKDLQATRKTLIRIAKSTQENERDLQTLESRIETLEADKLGLQTALQKDRESIAELILALNRIRRTPPEAMIAKPGAPIDTARSAMLLGDILPVLHEKAEGLKVKMQELKDIEEDLMSKRDQVLIAAATLQDEHKELSALLQKRESLYAGVNEDIKERQRKIAQISRESQNLAELVNRLNRERTRNIARNNTGAAIAKIPEPPKPGQPQLPLTGPIRVGYQDTDSFGAKSEGITIEGRSGALIVAPMGGTVRFAGNFKHYGNMIILEHKNGYHSLIAGLEKIDTVVDQSVSAGEPLGKLYKASGGKPSTLYFELRYKGKAVNPAKKFAQLG